MLSAMICVELYRNGRKVHAVRRTFAPMVIAFLLCGSSPQSSAQERIEAGIFLDSLSISQTNTNNFGVGGRFGYRIHRKVMIEGELAYDYGINFHEAYRNIANGDITAIGRTSIGVTHGLFGPTLQPAKGRFRPFVTLKGGFMDFRLSPSLLPLSNVESTLFGIRTSSFNVSMYPGAGVEASLGPVGLRFELGDEIYFNSGAYNNLRITFGPVLKF
jgi:Outer membrane protein beta-barrel domain